LLDLKAGGLTIFMVTHDAAIAAMADRVVRMQDGEIPQLAA
jgi:ABC-type lipoprotein export system ATPase subunit